MPPKLSDSPDRRGSNSDEAVKPRETASRGSLIARQPVEQPLLTVIVPVFNERATVVALLRAVITTPFDKQLIVVDDGSTDGSAECVEQLVRECAQIELYHHPRNLGKGAAVQTALRHATGQYTLIQDADLEYDPRDYARLLEPLLHGEADVVYGSRYLEPSTRNHARRRLLELGITALNVVVRLVYGRRLTDCVTCYKVLPTGLLRGLNLESPRFEFCAEVTAKVLRLGSKIKEVPIQYAPRTRAAGKKLRMLDGWRALLTLWKYRRWRRK